MVIVSIQNHLSLKAANYKNLNGVNLYAISLFLNLTNKFVKIFAGRLHCINSTKGGYLTYLSSKLVDEPLTIMRYFKKNADIR